MKQIDLNSWYRKDSYNFYKSFFTPLYTTTFQEDVDVSYRYCKEHGYSFFIFCLYVFLKASNEVPEFRHREIDGKVYDMELLHVSTPIMPKNEKNNQFSMAFMEYQKSFIEFEKNVKSVIENMSNGVIFNPNQHKEEGIVCLNYQPWYSFTGLSCAILDLHASMPLLSWGRFEQVGDKKIMPYAVQVNHAFIDGYHLGQFYQKVKEYFTHPEML